MTNLRLAAVLLLVVPLALSGCSDDENAPKPEADVTVHSGPPHDEGYVWSDKASPVLLRMPDGGVELTPYTSCWSGPPNDRAQVSNTCVDGVPPTLEDLETVEGESVPFSFGRPGWKFTASFTELVPCGATWRAKARRDGTQEFDLAPLGNAGRYRIDLFGRGPEGDVSVSFAWQMPKGPYPTKISIPRCAMSS